MPTGGVISWRAMPNWQVLSGWSTNCVIVAAFKSERAWVVVVSVWRRASADPTGEADNAYTLHGLWTGVIYGMVVVGETPVQAGEQLRHAAS